MSSPTWQDVYLHQYLVAQTPEEAEAIIADTNVRFVMITREMLEGKFYPIAKRLNAVDGDIRIIHDQSMAARLWNNEVHDGYELVFYDTYIKIFERYVND